MNVLAIDPGKSNLGVWYGKVLEGADGRIMPKTFLMEKMDMGVKVPLYQGAVQTVESIFSAVPGGCFPDVAIVETQDPHNMPARVVACTVYGYLRGKGIDCTFSSSRLKNDAIDLLAKQYDVTLVEKPSKEDQPDHKVRRRLMHSTNKKNSKAVVFKMLEELEQHQLASKIASVKDPHGRKKADDMTDALLLGIGLCIASKKKKRAVKIKH